MDKAIHARSIECVQDYHDEARRVVYFPVWNNDEQHVVLDYVMRISFFLVFLPVFRTYIFVVECGDTSLSRSRQVQYRYPWKYVSLHLLIPNVSLNLHDA